MGTLWTHIASTSLGLVRVSWSRAGLAQVALADAAEDLPAPPPGSVEGPRSHPWVAEVCALVDGELHRTSVPLNPGGTPFQQEVWRALQAVPWGEHTTYAEIAHRIGRPRATRAIGAACGANPLAIVVPCHRVLRVDGGLGGYRWGLDRKRLLLAREHDSPFLPLKLHPPPAPRPAPRGVKASWRPNNG